MDVADDRVVLEGGPFDGQVVDVDFRSDRVDVVDDDRSTKGHRYRYRGKNVEPSPGEYWIRAFVYEGIRRTTSRTRVFRLIGLIIGLIVGMGALLSLLILAAMTSTGEPGLLAVSALFGLATGVVLLLGHALVRGSRRLLSRQAHRSRSSLSGQHGSARPPISR